MKMLLLPTAVLLIPVLTMAQFDVNYVVNNKIMVPAIINSASVEDLTVDQKSQTIQYYDGLGRVIQSVSTQASPLRSDVVHPVRYDVLGRESIKYLPFVSGSDGGYKPVIFDVLGNYTGIADHTYSNNSQGKISQDSQPYAQTIFESSPLNRILKQGSAGEAWQPNDNPVLDKSIKMSYLFNQLNEVLLFEYDEQTEKIAMETLEYYEPNQLNANKTEDEHNNEVIEFTDKEGKVVLKKVQYKKEAGINLYAETYYIYDDFGNLVAVLPPEAIKAIKNQN